MGTTILSQVNNKYIIAKESSYGDKPSPFTKLDFGQVQTIEFTEDESLEEVASINTGHTIGHLEPGVYKGSITVNLRPTKSCLPVVLEAISGLRTNNSDGTYTVTTTLDNNYSYYIQATGDLTNIWDLSGVCFTSATLNVNKGSITSIDLTGVFKKASSAAGSVVPLTNNSALFSFLDSYVTIGAANLVCNSFTVTLDWNTSEDDSRAIQEMGAGERRLIAQVVKNRLKVSGSVECYTSTDIDSGYDDELDIRDIVVVLNRGSDNEHTFTITNTATTNRKTTLNVENNAKVMSFDYTGVDCSITGDL